MLGAPDRDIAHFTVMETPNIENTRPSPPPPNERATSPSPSSSFKLKNSNKTTSKQQKRVVKKPLSLDFSPENSMATSPNMENNQQEAETRVPTPEHNQQRDETRPPTPEANNDAHASNTYADPQSLTNLHLLQLPTPMRKILKKNRGPAFFHKKNGAHQLTRSQPWLGAQNLKMKMPSFSALQHCMTLVPMPS